MIPYFSVHDLKGTRPSIAHVNAVCHKQQKENFGGEQEAVVNNRDVCMQPQARLRLG
jgi:hypothetical protein